MVAHRVRLNRLLRTLDARAAMCPALSTVLYVLITNQYLYVILPRFQVLPFLALGLGVDDMFLVARTYVSVCESKDFSENEIVGETLRNCGLSVTLTSFTNACAFMMASFIPVPALQAFSRQVTAVKSRTYFITQYLLNLFYHKVPP